MPSSISGRLPPPKKRKNYMSYKIARPASPAMLVLLVWTPALLRELDRCRETALQIPTNGDCNATHFGIQMHLDLERKPPLPTAPPPRTTKGNPKTTRTNALGRTRRNDGSHQKQNPTPSPRTARTGAAQRCQMRHFTPALSTSEICEAPACSNAEQERDKGCMNRTVASGIL
jgi:hypothetical protein